MERFWAAAFQSVTCRTAGFNTVEIGALQRATLMLLMALMVIGACPVSTGGGIKTVTFGVLLLSLRALLAGRDRVEVFGRALPQKVVFAALSVSLLYVTTAGFGIFALALFDPRMELQGQAFEVVSALSTVGLSTGITAQLSTGSQIVLCVLMFVGRVGPLSLVLSVFRSGPRVSYQYPEEELVVG
jgi:Trk-type K+ transport system membrane component